MYQFSSIAEVDHAIEHFLLRTSKTTGRQISEDTRRNTRYYFTPKVRQVFCQGLRDGDLMRAVDLAMVDESRSHRSVGIVHVSQFANYYGLVTDEVHSWWAREGNRRHKPLKPLSDRIISKENLKKYFDMFLQDDPSNFVRARLYFFSALVLLTGARRKALIELRNSDLAITESELTVSITRLKSATRTKQLIHIPLHVVLPNGRPFGEALYRYLALRPDTPELFVDIHGKHGTGLATGIVHSMERNGELAGIGHITPHMFRFTCASIVSDYVGIKQAQQLLGHSEMRTTLRYASQSFDNTSRTTIASSFSTLAQSYQQGEL